MIVVSLIAIISVFLVQFRWCWRWSKFLLREHGFIWNRESDLFFVKYSNVVHFLNAIIFGWTKSKKAKLEAQQKQIKSKMVAVNKKLKCVNLQQLCYIIISSNACCQWNLQIFKNKNFTYDWCILCIPWNSMKLLNSCKHFMRL